MIRRAAKRDFRPALRIALRRAATAMAAPCTTVFTHRTRGGTTHVRVHAMTSIMENPSSPVTGGHAIHRAAPTGPRPPGTAPGKKVTDMADVGRAGLRNGGDRVRRRVQLMTLATLYDTA